MRIFPDRAAGWPRQGVRAAARLAVGAAVLLFVAACAGAAAGTSGRHQALQGISIKRLRVLVMPENFGADWAERGYPIER